MRVALVSTHRSDRGHYAPLRRLLGLDSRFEVLDDPGEGLIHNPTDVAVVLGDRVEMLRAAIKYVDARVPLLHIHGGEHTYGSLDERWRWAMTQLADEHCVATEEAFQELVESLAWRFAESSDRVHLTGAPGLDGITDRQPFPNAPRIVVLYNPAIDEETTKRECQAIYNGVVDFKGEYVWMKPNGDRFSGWIPGANEYDSEKFRDLLAAAHVIVGNSSAGIIEAPSLGTWTVNVGKRQAGRPRAGSILDVKADATLVRRAITDMLLQPRHTHANPYGDGHASERIRDVLLEVAR